LSTKIAEKKRMVVDTSVLVSAAILPKSVSGKAFELSLRNFELLASASTERELTEVLYRPKFDRYFQAENRLEFLALYAKATTKVVVTTVVTDCIDPKDNQFLELAVDGRASCILSSDAHLTDMHPYRGISILTPSAFSSDVGGQATGDS
jgi:putative PIN family toxin of toxin-antitoxin system